MPIRSDERRSPSCTAQLDPLAFVGLILGRTCRLALALALERLGIGNFVGVVLERF
jgi:hypothetical protein